MNHKFKVTGTAADGQIWTAEGRVPVNNDYLACLEEAMRQSFQQLTQGKAVYGKPGVGCRGPYQVTRFVLELVV